MPRLGLVVILVLGLVVTTPVVCVCGPTDHGGQALHSLLPHTHDHDEDAGALAEARAAETLPADSLLADSRTDNVPPPNITAQTGAAAGAFAAGASAIGLALAKPWRLPAERGRALVLPALMAPVSLALAPAGPPPRAAIA